MPERQLGDLRERLAVLDDICATRPRGFVPGEGDVEAGRLGLLRLVFRFEGGCDRLDSRDKARDTVVSTSRLAAYRRVRLPAGDRAWESARGCRA